MKKTLAICALLAVVAIGAKKITVQIYECPRCQIISEFAEATSNTHYCSGTSGKSHTKVIMTHKGSKVIEVK